MGNCILSYRSVNIVHYVSFANTLLTTNVKLLKTKNLKKQRQVNCNSLQTKTYSISTLADLNRFLFQGHSILDKELQ